MRLFVVKSRAYNNNGVICGEGTFYVKNKTELTQADIRKVCEWMRREDEMNRNFRYYDKITNIHEIDISELDRFKGHEVVIELTDVGYIEKIGDDFYEKRFDGV